jgi:hypothetical protein
MVVDRVLGITESTFITTIPVIQKKWRIHVEAMGLALLTTIAVTFARINGGSTLKLWGQLTPQFFSKSFIFMCDFILKKLKTR